MSKPIFRERVTSLETFIHCPYKYKYAPPSINTNPLTFGNYFHSYVNAHLYGKKHAEEILSSIVGRKEKVIMEHGAKNFKKYLNEQGYEILIDELRLFHSYENEVGVLHVEGSFDYLVQDVEGNKILIDLKTSSSKWNEKRQQDSLQKKLYTYLFQKNFLKTIDSFEYFVVIKTLKENFHIYKYDTKGDKYLDLYVEGIFDKYLYSMVNEEYPAYKTEDCWFCPLRKNGQCPLRSLTPF